MVLLFVKVESKKKSAVNPIGYGMYSNHAMLSKRTI